MRDEAASRNVVRFADTNASVLFDLVRGLAAVVVLLEHARNIFFVDFGELPGHRHLLALPYLAVAGGHQAVVVFFLLSGYFIAGAVDRSVQRKQWQWSGYLLRRIVRLWIVLIPALFLCLLWDRIGIHLGHAPALYSGAVPNHVTGDVRHLLGVPVFLGNLFFVQGILTPTLGSDGALWSLANEFWYYILFPLGVFALLTRVSLAQRLLQAALFVAVAWLVRGGILAMFPIWLAGAILVKTPPPRLSARIAARLRIAGVILYVPTFCLLARTSLLSPLLNDYLLAVVTFGLLWLLLSATGLADPRSLAVLGSRTLARFSYSLYALHLPLLTLIASLLIHDTRWRPTPLRLLYLAGILLTTVLYAYAVAMMTEFRTDAVRRYLERLFGMAVQQPGLPSEPLEKHTGGATLARP